MRLSLDIGTKALFPSENIVNIHHLFKTERKCCTEQIEELQRIPVKYFFSTEIGSNISLQITKRITVDENRAVEIFTRNKLSGNNKNCIHMCCGD
ncbi:Hypothetical predicted protein [Octopus vulgaris]|uniref:Uncharacterized protein n=1 Tax=Octopus vulgaris TaxID=6645 RepID=A0AA36FMU3_OCTVU|nr:Hypothetical predicted protein [Octopus vulgaris]